MFGLKEILEQIEQLGDYDLHDILSKRKTVKWCEWHLNIGKNKNVIRIAEKFHEEVKKRLKSSSNITRDIDMIKTTFLEFLPPGGNDSNDIKNYLGQALTNNDPVMIIKAYTVSQNLTKRLHLHSAVNTYHSLKLYCTLLNCPILAQTQEYTEAFTRILFHPKLEQYLVGAMQVYRGAVFDENKFVDNYEEGATIITTTFLSTSAKPAVAAMFCDPSEVMNKISLFCTYNLKNTNRPTALDLRNISVRPNEEEILILRYVPFKIQSVERQDDGRRIVIRFDQCEEQLTV